MLPGPWGPMDGIGEPGTSVPPQREGGLREGAALEIAEAGQSDADLVHAMRAGDDSAYEELFRRHSDAVRRYARSCCRDAHTADDLTAEVFARTLQAVRGGAGPEQAVRAYLLTTVRRVAASWTRTAKREQLVEDFAVFAAAGRALRPRCPTTTPSTSAPMCGPCTRPSSPWPCRRSARCPSAGRPCCGTPPSRRSRRARSRRCSG